MALPLLRRGPGRPLVWPANLIQHFRFILLHFLQNISNKDRSGMAATTYLSGTRDKKTIVFRPDNFYNSDLRRAAFVVLL